MAVRLTGVLAVVVLASSVVGAPAMAASPTVRLPRSAAEWARFTPAEKDAAVAWIWAQKARMEAEGTWEWEDGPATILAADDSVQAAAAITGGTECGIKMNKQPWATYARGWSSTWTSAKVPFLTTGVPPNYVNTFYNDGVRFSWGWQAAGSGTYQYGESNEDFAFPWDATTWKVQSWGAAKLSSGAWLFAHQYCGATKTTG